MRILWARNCLEEACVKDERKTKKELIAELEEMAARLCVTQRRY
jgi:hypothetical protein